MTFQVRATDPPKGWRKSLLQRRWRVGLLLLLITGGVVFAVWWYSPSNAERRYSRMDLVSLRQLLDREPDNGLAWRQLGLRLAADGDPLAEVSLMRAYRLRPTDPDVATALGEVFLASHRYPEAFQVLRAAIEHHPHFIPARMALGRLYVRRSSYQHALGQFEAVVATDPRFAAAWYQLSICYLQMQQAQKAEDAIDRALRERPGEPQFLALKGSIDAAIGKIDAAIQESQTAARLAPSDLKIQTNLATLLLANHRGPQDLADAERVIDRVAHLAPNYPLLPYQRGELERMRQNWPAAVQHLEQAAVASPGQTEVYFALSDVYRRLGRTADADRALALYRRRQDLQRRIEETRIAIGEQPNSAALYEKLAQLQYQSGDRPAAISSLKNALEIAPGSERIRQLLVALRQSSPSRAAEP